MSGAALRHHYLFRAWVCCSLSCCVISDLLEDDISVPFVLCRHLPFWPSGFLNLNTRFLFIHQKVNGSPNGTLLVFLSAIASVRSKCISIRVVCVSIGMEWRCGWKDIDALLAFRLYSDTHRVSIVKGTGPPGAPLLWRNRQCISLILSTNEHVYRSVKAS